MRAVLEQVGIFLGTRILAAKREAERLAKPKGSPHTKREIPFEASSRHEIWTSDVRYINHSIPETGQAYVVSILDNYSRADLASAVTIAQDTNAYLSVLHAPIERHGSPGTIVTDGAGIFKANRERAVYRSLGIKKEEIEKRQPWQSFIETTFNIQRRMVDFGFGGRRAGSRFVRRLDVLGYARLKHWRIYAEEGLARCEVALWLGEDDLVVEYGGQPLSRYDVSFSPGNPRLEAVINARLFATRYRPPQLKLFSLEDVLGDAGWLKALGLPAYAYRSRGRPEDFQ